MPSDPFRQHLSDYILSGHAYVDVPTTETTRLLAELKELAIALPDSGRQVFVWSQATGWRDLDGNPPSGVQFGQPDPQKVTQEILNLPESAIFVLKDFGFYVQPKCYSYADVVIAWLCEARDVLASTGRTVIFLGPEFEVPAALANDITTVTFPLPADPTIESSVRFVMEGHELDEAILPSIISACRGMTQQQVEDRAALALRKFKTLDADAAGLILREKAEVLRRSGLLKYLEPPEGWLGLIGGCDSVKAHIVRDKTCFSEEARAFGIDPPRGILLVGISGCGKTAISLAAAAELDMPLIQFDVGSLMSKWVGESEANARSALAQIEAMAPCVVQMDAMMARAVRRMATILPPPPRRVPKSHIRHPGGLAGPARLLVYWSPRNSSQEDIAMPASASKIAVGVFFGLVLFFIALPLTHREAQRVDARFLTEKSG